MTKTPKYGIDSGRGKAYVAITVVFAVLALSSIVLRVLAIHLRQRSFQVHDYLICAAAVVSMGYFADAIHGAEIALISLDPSAKIPSTSRCTRWSRTAY